eukprot:TRINITY_DN28754_c0_g1_i1.p1 TRINITY_DN28754_c0_g1~~TRINITY_DN28754_c0_g1_i1.p1  ORF type:complete len:256 (+),score=74.18 TRINITY_DN28754_c0_g1_i1:76-843(+)
MGLGREAGEVKYFPPNFDPSAGTGKTLSKRGAPQVRIMLPMGLQCDACGEWIAQNKKFSSTKEKVRGEEYLGLTIYRLTIKCPRCSQEIAIKTDPKNHDYIVEWGATRNYQHHLAEARKADEEEARLEKEKGDTIAEHNQKVLETRKEMSMLEKIEEIQHAAVVRASVTDDVLMKATLEKHEKADDTEQRLEDDQEAERVFKRKAREAKGPTITLPDNTVPDSPPAGFAVKKKRKEKKSKKSKDGGGLSDLLGGY